LFFIKHNELFQILVYSSFVIKLTSLCTTGDIEKTTGKENMKENPHDFNQTKITLLSNPVL